ASEKTNYYDVRIRSLTRILCIKRELNSCGLVRARRRASHVPVGRALARRRGRTIAAAPAHCRAMTRNAMPPLSNLAVRDVETLVHPYTNLAALRETGPLIIERGQGVFVYDTQGKAYIEGMAGLWCT